MQPHGQVKGLAIRKSQQAERLLDGEGVLIRIDLAVIVDDRVVDES